MTVPTSALTIEIDRQQLPIYLQICAGATASMSLRSLCSYGLVSDEPSLSLSTSMRRGVFE
ncbi:hypothetical protein B0G71_5731 [Paraburkholderia sp. BL27I4N3]|uniref:hypothetical protein n=1 Tax=Paraburkholderia sp. BL27I4N3 TaxID=1938805 RepID=UPI000E256CBA|nr:hypothetical protein [Paraburkholderia sp. BL27I4N3]REE22518.1 hypothetical protein B0G71_5731 [Paraburkholderia sp. BL27I4N3]